MLNPVMDPWNLPLDRLRARVSQDLDYGLTWTWAMECLSEVAPPYGSPCGFTFNKFVPMPEPTGFPL